MRTPIPYNFTSYNNYIQPEEPDPLKNIQIVYPSTGQKQYGQINLTSHDNNLSFLNKENGEKKEKEIEFSPRNPRVRDFLRHTTYMSKPESVGEKKKT